MRINIKKLFSVIILLLLSLATCVSLSVSADPISTTDSDGDGWTDIYENNTSHTDPYNPDTDGDGIIDSKDKDPNKIAEEVHQFNKDEWEREEKEDDMLNIFLFVLLLSFGLFSLLAGVFTAYFGAGKSRAIGGFLLVIGIVIILIWLYFGVMQDYPDDSLLGVIHWEAAKTLEAFITVLGAIIGALAAVAVFLLAIMKS